MIMRDRVPCRVPMLGLAFIGLLGLVALPGWSLSQQPVEVKTEIKKVDKQLEKNAELKADFVEVVLDGELVQAGKGDGDRLDRLEKQLEVLLQEVKAMRSGSGQHADKDVKGNVKPAVKSNSAKDATPFIFHTDGVQSDKGRVLEYYTAVDQGGGEHAVTLTRATYKMPKEKAEALSKFLSDQVKGQVLETKVDGEGIVVTTTPHIQRTIHDFINLVQGGKQNFTFEFKGAEFKLANPEVEFKFADPKQAK